MPEQADEPGMSLAELRKTLKHAHDGPVSIAMATGKDGKLILSLHRRRASRALDRDMKKTAADSRNHRYGTAMADPKNPDVLRFSINKSAPGIARKLIAALKGTGFSKVEVSSGASTGSDG